MNTNLRIESFKIDKLRRVMIFCSLILLIISFVKIFTTDNIRNKGWGWLLDILIFTILPIIFLVKTKKDLSKRKGQFIEWTNDQIIYKLKHELTEQTIYKSSIRNIKIGIEIIEIYTNNDEVFKLDISDFDKYEDRMKIKLNFG